MLSFSELVLWAADARSSMSTYAVLLFSLFVAYGMVVCFRFLKTVAPALHRWAERQGLEILRQSEVGMFRKALSGGTTTQVDFELLLRDSKGQKQEAVRIGSPWIAHVTVDRCPVEIIRWNNAALCDPE